MRNHDETRDRRDGRQAAPRGIDPLTAFLTRLALFLVFALVISLALPADLFAYVFGSMTGIAAFVSASFAAFTRERLTAGVPGRWDEAAVLCLVSLLAGLFVDPQVVEQYRQAGGL